MSKSYLAGMLHDATERDYTYRISQKHKGFVEKLSSLIENLGFDAWTYEEGDRGIHVVEFSRKAVEDFQVETPQEKKDYIRGYFDSEGSVPKSPEVRFYIYFAQKDKADLEEVKHFIEELGIKTGKLHRPSRKAKPEYWRFYVSSDSHERFGERIGSWHPVKSQLMREMIQSAP